MAKEKLEIKNLNVSVEGKKVVNGISLVVNSGEIHVIMGPNGSGKSTFANALMGMPKYSVKGKISLSGKEISKMKIHERARAGLFLAFQNPPEIENVKNANLVRQASLAKGDKEDAVKFKQKFESALEQAGLDKEFYGRPVNYGFSGGERKKNELAQLMALNPKFAILDEIDSGLDIDSIRKTAGIITNLAKNGIGIIFITHSPSILKFISPTKVYAFSSGRIAREGGPELITKLEREGFAMLDEGKKIVWESASSKK